MLKVAEKAEYDLHIAISLKKNLQHPKQKELLIGKKRNGNNIRLIKKR